MEEPGEFSPAIEAVFTTAPPEAFSAPAAALVQRKTPIRFTCSRVSHSSSVMRWRSLLGMAVRLPGVPALLARKSSRPRSATACSTMRTQSSASPTLPGAPMTSRPSPQSRATCSGPRGSSARWLIATLAPLRASCVTSARPMPEAPPVTRAVLPARS